ncbi:ABC transporter substrate-binding protein [Cohnella sp.]|uniref:ABC transporter substrate-binding protein n=1 Tax=Cohnella sp. TaxID=1883426 RepID=UPI0035650F00
MKKALSALVMLALVISIIGCGANKNNGAASSAPAASSPASTADASPSASADDKKDLVTLRVAWWGGQSRHDYTLKVIELYESLNPHVTIEPEYASFDDHWKKLAPNAAAGNLPDVIQMDISYLSQYGGRGQLEDLTPFTQNGTLNVSDISEASISGGKLGNELFAMNLGSNALLAVVDKVMLEKAGGTMPSQEWKWDDLSKLGPIMKAQGKILMGDLRHDVFFPFYLRGQNQHMYAADGTSLGYTDDKLFTDFYTTYKSWYDNGYLLSLDKLAQKKGTPEDGELEMGNALSAWGWSNQYILSSSVAKRPFEILPVPGWNDNKALFLKPSMYFSISKSSKAKEEAAKFISFWVNDIEANKIIMGERGVPVSSKVKEALKPSLTPDQAKVFDYVAWAEENSSQMDPPNPVGAVEVDKLLKDTVEQILYNKTTIEAGAAKFREEANKILAKNKK